MQNQCISFFQGFISFKEGYSGVLRIGIEPVEIFWDLLKAIFLETIDGMLNIEELGVSEKLFAKIDKNGDGLAGRAELSIAARTHAALNNMISEILPPEKASKLDATV